MATFFETYGDFKQGHIEEDLGQLLGLNYVGRRFQAILKKNGKKKSNSPKRYGYLGYDG